DQQARHDALLRLAVVGLVRGLLVLAHDHLTSRRGQSKRVPQVPTRTRLPSTIWDRVRTPLPAFSLHSSTLEAEIGNSFCTRSPRGFCADLRVLFQRRLTPCTITRPRSGSTCSTSRGSLERQRPAQTTTLSPFLTCSLRLAGLPLVLRIRRPPPRAT